MSIVLDKVTDVQDQIVGAFSLVKEPVTSGVTTVVDFVTDKVPTVPALPFAEYVPTPAEFVNNQYRFAKQVIDAQKDLYLSIAKAAAPLTNQLLARGTVVRTVSAPKITVSTPKVTTTRKPAARKTTARKPAARKTTARTGA